MPHDGGTPQRKRRSVDGLAPTPKKEWEGVDWMVAEERHRHDYRFNTFVEHFHQSVAGEAPNPILGAEALLAVLSGAAQAGVLRPEALLPAVCEL